MHIERLRRFVVEMAEIVETHQAEDSVLRDGTLALKRLVGTDDWLADAYAQPSPERYQQYLLYADARGRFSVVSFVWGPGQQTPVHDHTVWGLIGMLRGAERSVSFEPSALGGLRAGKEVVLQVGDVEAVSPSLGDIHRVSNVHADRVSISIHVYGANIGEVTRSVYPLDALDPNGQPCIMPKPFISGYSNTTVPNLWAHTTDAIA